MLNRFRIRMVERYLAGRMVDSEARSFHRRLESDPKLRQLLQEEKTIEKALLHDRDSIPVMGTQRLERMLKGENHAGPGDKALYRAATGNGGIWPSANSSMFQRLTEWLTRREALAAISAIGSVGVALAIYSLVDMKSHPAEMRIIPPSSPALTPSPMGDSGPAAGTGALPAIDTSVPARHDNDSVLHPAHDSSPGGHSDRDSSPVVQRRELANSKKSNEKLVPVSDSTSVRQRTIEQGKNVSPEEPSKPNLIRVAVRPLDSVEVMRKYLEREARRKAAQMETSDSVQLKLKMEQQKPPAKP